MTSENKERTIEDIDREINQEIHGLEDRFSAQILADFWQQHSLTLFYQVAHWKARWASVTRRYTELQVQVAGLEEEILQVRLARDELSKDLQVSKKAHSDALEKIKRMRAAATKSVEGGSNGV
jgi:chromosome segregation ATPase